VTTPQALQEAEGYVKHALESQRKLGYSTKVDEAVYKAAVAETERAVRKLRNAQHRRVDA